MMVVTAQDLRAAGVACPILVGGAALSNRFTRLKIAPEYPGVVAYANDAMTGLDLANQLVDAARREPLAARLASETVALQNEAARRAAAATPAPVRKANVRRDHDIPTPPDLKLHVLHDYDGCGLSALHVLFRFEPPCCPWMRREQLAEAQEVATHVDAYRGGECHRRASSLRRSVGRPRRRSCR
jgi:cobalamin-dependent methionine synthase I